MKKVISMLLVSVMLLGLVGCSSSDTEPAAQTPAEETSTEAPAEEAEAPAEEVEEAGLDYALEQVGPINDNPMSDIRVRQAIAYAIDMEAIVEGLFEGKAIVADSLIENGPWKAEGLDIYAYNPERATELFDAAGWDYNYTIDVAYYYSDQLTVDLMTTIQAYLELVGVKMEFAQVTGDTAAQLWTSPEDMINGPAEVEWDIAYGAIGAPVLSGFYDRFTTNASNNSHTPTDEAYDALIAATKVANLEEQMAAYNTLSEYENKALYALPLYYQQVFIAQSDRVDRKDSQYGNEQYAYDWRIIDWDVTPTEDGEYVLYSNSGPTEFFQTTHVNPSLMMTNKLLFDRLITADGSLIPTDGQLAESYSLSDDGLVLSMTLRDGLTWHDGEPLTSEDVKFSYEYYIQYPGLNTVLQSVLNSIEGVEAFVDGSADGIDGIAIDGNDITITFAAANPDTLTAFSQWPPLPKHLLEDSDPINAQQASYWQYPIGSGPFMLEDVNMNDYAVLVPFAEYWDQSGTGNIEKIYLSPSADSDPNLVINSEAGRIDYAFTKVVADVQAIEAMDNMTIIPADIRYTRLLYFNKFPKK